MAPKRWQSLCVTRPPPPRANQVQRGQDVPALPGVLRPRGRREPRAQLRAGAVARARASTCRPHAQRAVLARPVLALPVLALPVTAPRLARAWPHPAARGLAPLGLGRTAHSAAEGLACPDTSRGLRPPRPKRAHADGVSRLYR